MLGIGRNLSLTSHVLKVSMFSLVPRGLVMGTPDKSCQTLQLQSRKFKNAKGAACCCSQGEKPSGSAEKEM